MESVTRPPSSPEKRIAGAAWAGGARSEDNEIVRTASIPANGEADLTEANILVTYLLSSPLGHTHASYACTKERNTSSSLP